MNAQHFDGQPSSRGSLPALDFRLIWRRKWTFVLCAVATTALGALYLAIEQPTYEISRRLLLEQERLASDDAAPAMPGRQFAPTQAELLRSPKVIRYALEQAPLEVPEAWANDAVGFVLESLTVTPVVDTSVLKIRFRGKDPQAATRFVEALVDGYRTVLKEQQSKTVDSLKTLLTQEEQRRRDELNGLQARHVALLQQSPYPAHLQENARVKSEHLMQLSRQLSEVQLRRTNLASRLRQVRDVTASEVARGKAAGETENLVAVVSYTEGNAKPGRNHISETTVLADSRLGKGLSSEQNLVFELLRDEQGRTENVLSEVQRQLTQAQVRKQQLSVQYGPKHDSIRQVEAEIVRLEHMLREQMSSLMDSLQQRLIAEEASEVELARRCEEQAKEVKLLDSFVAQDETLQAEIKRTEAAYDLVFAQLKQVSLVDEALTTGRGAVSVVDLESGSRVPPKVWPLPAPLLAISFAIGVFAALMWTYSGVVIQASSESRGGTRDGAIASAPSVS